MPETVPPHVFVLQHWQRSSPRLCTAVYALTHATTEAFNELQEEFFEEESEIETVAREAIAEDIGFILAAYDYEFDIEEAIAPRDW